MTVLGSYGAFQRAISSCVEKGTGTSLQKFDYGAQRAHQLSNKLKMRRIALLLSDRHRDWVSGISFHPSGAQLASSSGDSSIKLWDFHSRKCTATLMDHTHAVWAVEFHSAGHYMASASMDHCSKLWDVTTEKSLFSFRGHLDSVNSVCWHDALIATASSDKTIALWDPRSGSCVQTFNSHANSCNYVTASPKVYIL